MIYIWSINQNKTIMTLKSNYFILIFLIVGVLSSCGPSKAKVIVDNPTSKAVLISFDNGYEKKIGPYKSETISFDNEVAKMTVDGQEVGEIFLSPGQEYILNPTFSTYVIEKIMYGDNAMSQMLEEMLAEKDGKTSSSPLPMKSIKVDTHDYFGYVQTTNALLIDRFWDLGTKEAVPNQIEVSSYDQTAAIIKIFTERDFINFHKLGQAQ